jgi:hypothetical protein
MVAGATARGELAGWVDLPNSLDPRSLLRSGVELRSVLWVRPPQARSAARAAELLIQAGFAVVVLDLESASPRELDRLGLAPWLRLQRAARATRAAVLVLGAQGRVGPQAGLSLRTERDRARFEGGLFEGLDCRAHVVRSREAPASGALAFRLHYRPAPRPLQAG